MQEGFVFQGRAGQNKRCPGGFVRPRTLYQPAVKQRRSVGRKTGTDLSPRRASRSVAPSKATRSGFGCHGPGLWQVRVGSSCMFRVAAVGQASCLSVGSIPKRASSFQKETTGRMPVPPSILVRRQGNPFMADLRNPVPLFNGQVSVFFQEADRFLQRISAERVCQDLGTSIDDSVNNRWLARL